MFEKNIANSAFNAYTFLSIEVPEKFWSPGKTWNRALFLSQQKLAQHNSRKNLENFRVLSKSIETDKIPGKTWKTLEFSPSQLKLTKFQENLACTV